MDEAAHLHTSVINEGLRRCVQQLMAEKGVLQLPRRISKLPLMLSRLAGHRATTSGNEATNCPSGSLRADESARVRIIAGEK